MGGPSRGEAVTPLSFVVHSCYFRDSTGNVALSRLLHMIPCNESREVELASLSKVDPVPIGRSPLGTLCLAKKMATTKRRLLPMYGATRFLDTNSLASG